MGARAILDEEHFGMMTGGDAALQAEIVTLFRAQAELWTRLLVVDAPVQTWRDAAHTLKGSARGLGLWALADACAQAEQLGRGGAVDGREIAAGLERARAALADALAALPRTDAAND
ncbi:MAG: Hpt domain-containing protein [Hyphomonadaceae bacterium]|jgi:HPt (histidine-containing phosphotransfer) domain-containing protein|nr:Hpt domain-containing protein [Hyphomonadaceae bacterium]